MSLSELIRGRSLRGVTPCWAPLLDLASEHVEDFMWMFEVELDDGTRLHAYKHRDTRRYLHLDHGGGAFVYCGEERYQEADPYWLLELALSTPRFADGFANIVRQNCWSTWADLKWARSASRHRISRERSRHVIQHCGLLFGQEPPFDSPADADLRLIFLGDDAGGVALEVVAIELEDGNLLVIHAMKLRDRYREWYEEAEAWRR
jgi:hypothetical protein